MISAVRERISRAYESSIDGTSPIPRRWGKKMAPTLPL